MKNAAFSCPIRSNSSSRQQNRARKSLPHALVVVLNEETETEQKCENGVGFSAESEEQTVPDGFVGEIEPCRLGVGRGEGVEVEMLDGVEQDDGQYGKAAEHVGHVDSGVAAGFGGHFGNIRLLRFIILCVGCRFLAPEVQLVARTDF